MTAVPSEISAIVKGAVRVTKAFRELQRAARDEASDAVRTKYRKALHAELEKLSAGVEKASEMARRPNAPIDLEGLFRGVMNVIGAVQSGKVERVVRGAAKKIIDVEVE